MRLSVACAPADFVERFASTVSALSFFLPSHNHITVGIFALQGRCPVAYFIRTCHGEALPYYVSDFPEPGSNSLRSSAVQSLKPLILAAATLGKIFKSQTPTCHRPSERSSRFPSLHGAFSESSRYRTCFKLTFRSIATSLAGGAYRKIKLPAWYAGYFCIQ